MRSSPGTRLARLFLVLACLLAAIPAQAAVTITFWSHELGNGFPHAFVTLRGIPDAGGAPVDVNFGFTAASVTPRLLFGPVSGRLDIATPGYIRGSTAQFSMMLSDAHYADILALAAAWDAKGPDSVYDLKTHNCVHFIREAARRAGLTGLDHPALMKKPRSYLQAVAAENVGRLTVIDQPGKAYLATLEPIVPVTAGSFAAAPRSRRPPIGTAPAPSRAP